ncbi:MAG: hypothetical protein A2Y40_10150 [Candidatus Margulisbacteria bacterium GWF2_35_9]|nr:MAG: hypothetical protein A2Y40_10150 [Candidatus Margulisbacteria bacterium GWF2_35_9]
MISVFTFISRISPLIATILNISIGLLVFFRAKNKKQGLLFLCFNVLLSIWSFSCFIQSDVYNENWCLLFDKILYVAAILIIPVYVLSVKVYIRIKVTLLVIISIIIALVLIPLNFTCFFRLGVIFKEGSRYTINPSIGWYIYVVLFAVITFTGLYLILRYSIKENTKKIPFFLIAYGFLITGGLSYYVLSLPFINGVFTVNLLNLVSSVMAFVYAVIFAYAILKHELMDIKLVITKTIAYGGVGGLVCFTLMLVYFFTGGNDVLRFLVLLFVTLFWTYFAYRLRRFIQTPLEEKWITNWYDKEKLLDRIAEELAEVIEKKDVFSIISQKLNNVIRINKIDGFVIYEPKRNSHSSINQLEIRNVNTRTSLEGRIDSRHPLIHYLKDNRSVQHFCELDDMLKRSLTEYCIDKASVILPFYSPDECEGFMVLGRKVSEDKYKEEDMQLFRIIQTQANMVFDRVRPYENIKRQYKQERRWREQLEKQRDVVSKDMKELSYWITHDLKNDLAGLRLFVDHQLAVLFSSKATHKRMVEHFADLSLQIKIFLGRF